MPRSIPTFRPPGWTPSKRVRTDAIDRDYGRQAWRDRARRIIARDGGICRLCGEPGANTADHIVEKRQGGTDDDANLRAVHATCHNTRHGRRSAPRGVGGSKV